MRCNLCQHAQFRQLPFYYEWEGKRFQGYRCAGCRLIRLDPLPTDTELNRLYSEEYFRDGLHGLDSLGTDYETHADRQLAATSQAIRSDILARHPGAKSLFELGAAMGHFLAAARDAGFQCAGIEFSPAAVARAREKFGLELHSGNLEDLDLSKLAGSWDVVYAGDLLEHLRDPSGALDKVARLLAPGGLCVMRIPGTYNLIFTRLTEVILRMLGRQQRLPDRPYHLYEYTTDTARRLFAAHFSRVEIRTEATPPGRLNLKNRSLGYLAKYLFQFINYPLTRLTGRCGDRMTVYAWKPN